MKEGPILPLLWFFLFLKHILSPERLLFIVGSRSLSGLFPEIRKLRPISPARHIILKNFIGLVFRLALDALNSKMVRPDHFLSPSRQQ